MRVICVGNDLFLATARLAGVLCGGVLVVAAVARVAGAVLAGTHVLGRIALARIRAAAVGIRSAAFAVYNSVISRRRKH